MSVPQKINCMKSTLLSFILILIVIYVGVGVFIYVIQRQLIYWPTSAMDLPNVKSIKIESDGEIIAMWCINEGRQNAVLYFGGNAENVGNNAENFKNIFKHHSVFLVNYRGYSGSTGTPSESGHYADALNIYDYLRNDYKTISVIGRSLGGGVATYLAINRKLEKLVLVTPFDSIERVATRMYPIYPVSKMLKDKYDSYGRASMIDVPTFVIVAEQDEIISRVHSDRLINALNKKNTTVSIIAGATHNAIDIDGQYSQVLSDYFR